ncbi:proteasome assembly chaperone family protein [Candidatus Woesearchaeota archaeon]|nr:proteasome assembly chaperone family protein [Candidatus Woesearchaeota archaeon]
MELQLQKKPQNVTIIEGFPGFGLVATIATEFLINHLDAEQIGKIVIEEVPPIVAVHSGQVVEPVGVFYSKKYNLIILHALTSINGLEWGLAKKIGELSSILKAKEIICIEGIGSMTETSNTFFISNKNEDRFIKKTGLSKLKDGIIMGVTGALTLNKKLPISCIFAETHSNLPDSRAAAKIITTLDNYLDLKVDPKPLIKKAEEFEVKIKGLLEKSKNASEMKEKKELTYLG